MTSYWLLDPIKTYFDIDEDDLLEIYQLATKRRVNS